MQRGNQSHRNTVPLVRTTSTNPWNTPDNRIKDLEERLKILEDHVKIMSGNKEYFYDTCFTKVNIVSENIGPTGPSACPKVSPSCPKDSLDNLVYKPYQGYIFNTEIQ